MAGSSMFWALLNAFLALVFFLGVFGQEADKSDGEFVAGTFILTQKLLDEAPYRYAGVLRQILDNIEVQDPPKKEELSECSTQYKIEPAGNYSLIQTVITIYNIYILHMSRV